MHEQFPNWMSKVSPSIDQARLGLRWNSAKAVSNAADDKTAVQLTEQALGLGSHATEVLRNAARKEDPTYVSDDDALELAVLAAGALASLMASGTNVGDTAATSIVSGSFGRGTPKGMSKDLLEFAQVTLQKISEEQRREVTVPAWTGKTISDAIAKQTNAADFPSTQAGIVEISQAIASSLKSQFQTLSEALSRLSFLQRESSDLAFLLVSEYSFAAKKSVATLSSSEAAFSAGQDLLEITQFASALPSFHASLFSLLKPAKPDKKAISLGQVVSALSEKLRKRCMADTILFPKTTPLHFALTKCDEVSGGDAWTAAFEAVTSVKSQLSVTAEHIAAQFYLEGMLIRHLGEK
jgi:hypothetical protein